MNERKLVRLTDEELDGLLSNVQVLNALHTFPHPNKTQIAVMAACAKWLEDLAKKKKKQAIMNKGYTIIEVLVALFGIFSAAVAITLIYVLLHFIGKIW